jgi:hypothetical protein
VTDFRDIIISGCNHVTSWNDPRITRDMVRIIGTKRAMTKAEDEYYVKVREQNLDIVVRNADTMQTSVTSHGNWKTADAKTRNALDRIVHEVQMLQLHKNIVVEMTYNKTNCWLHSQMAVVTDLPSQSHLDEWKAIQVILAPVGTKKLPPREVTKSMLFKHGWREVRVGTAPEMEHRLNCGICAKRKQYAIRPCIAMTIHRAMGADFGSVVSCVGDGKDGYKLWQKEQVEVLISRTHTLSDLTFVGSSPEQTADHLVELLFKQSAYSLYMRHVVAQMTNPEGIRPVIHPLRS